MQVAKLGSGGHLDQFEYIGAVADYRQFMVSSKRENERNTSVILQQISSQNRVRAKIEVPLPAASGAGDNVCEEIIEILRPDVMRNLIQ